MFSLNINYMNFLQLLISIPLSIGLYIDTWETFKIYNGTGSLAAWRSFGIIATWLFALGIAIRGVNILIRSSREGAPGQVMNGLSNLIISIVVFGILWKIAGL